MNQFWTIFMDSLRESKDKVILKVLLALCALVILFTFSISFEELSPEEALRDHLTSLGDASITNMGFTTYSSVGPLSTSLRDVRPVIDADGLEDSFLGGLTAELAFPNVWEFDEAINRWNTRFADFRPGKARKTKSDSTDAKPLNFSDEARLEFLKQRLNADGWTSVYAEEIGKDPLAYRVSVVSAKSSNLKGVHKAGLFFGAIKFDLSQSSRGAFIAFIQALVIGGITGSLGMIIAVLSTSAFIPDLLQKGTLDLTLARPISRIKLLLFKYCGGIWFILLLAAFLVGGTWLGFSSRTGEYQPRQLLIIGLIVLQFAVLYAISVLMAVITRSGVASAMTALGVWFISSTVTSARSMLKDGGHWNDSVPTWAQWSLESLYTVLPKVTDMGNLSGEILTSTYMSASEIREMQQMTPDPGINWFFSMGTTGLFAAAAVGLAAWIFSRRDY